MATTNVSITITTPADITVAQVVDLLSNYWGYQATVNDGANPETRSAYVKRMTANYLVQQYKEARLQANQATAEAVRLAIKADAERVTAT